MSSTQLFIWLISHHLVLPLTAAASIIACCTIHHHHRPVHSPSSPAASPAGFTCCFIHHYYRLDHSPSSPVASPVNIKHFFIHQHQRLVLSPWCIIRRHPAALTRRYRLLYHPPSSNDAFTRLHHLLHHPPSSHAAFTRLHHLLYRFTSVATRMIHRRSASHVIFATSRRLRLIYVWLKWLRLHFSIFSELFHNFSNI